MNFIFHRFLIFTFATPSLIVTIFCFAIGSNPKNLEIGILNHEVGVDCKNFTEIATCDYSQLSCAFLSNLGADQKFKLVVGIQNKCGSDQPSITIL